MQLLKQRCWNYDRFRFYLLNMYVRHLFFTYIQKYSNDLEMSLCSGSFLWQLLPRCCPRKQRSCDSHEFSIYLKKQTYFQITLDELLSLSTISNAGNLSFNSSPTKSCHHRETSVSIYPNHCMIHFASSQPYMGWLTYTLHCSFPTTVQCHENCCY